MYCTQSPNYSSYVFLQKEENIYSYFFFAGDKTLSLSDHSGSRSSTKFPHKSKLEAFLCLQLPILPILMLFQRRWLICHKIIWWVNAINNHSSLFAKIDALYRVDHKFGNAVFCWLWVSWLIEGFFFLGSNVRYIPKLQNDTNLTLIPWVTLVLVDIQ